MTPMTLTLPAALVDTDWLARHLDDPRLRVLESTVYLTRDEAGQRRTVSGRRDWAEAHIPGSAFADLIVELSDPANTRYSFAFPPAERFAAAMGRLGVGDDSTVVVYDRAGNSWAARLWWLLRAYGFDRAAVLNGGWNRWTAEGRPISAAPSSYPPARFTPRPRPDLIADKAEVLRSIGDERRLLINALSPDDFYGRLANPSRRPGHIPGSVNVPSAGPSGIVEPDTALYLPLAELRRRFAAESATERERVITYCGGGIAASSTALALHLLGVPDIAVYDGSLSEWAADPELPLETE